MSLYWTVNGVETRGIVGSHPVITHGETATFTLRFDESLPDHLEKYEQVRSLLDQTNKVSYGTFLDKTPWIREYHSTGDGQIVKLEPGSESESSQGVWGLVVGGDDNTSLPQKEAVVSLEVFILADVEDYADRSAVRDAFAVTDDTPSYIPPDSDEGPFVGGVEAAEAVDKSYPLERSLDDDRSSHPGSLSTFLFDSYSLDVSVEDQGTGDLIDDREVSLTLRNDIDLLESSGTTDTGQAEFDVLMTGSYKLKADAERYEANSVNIDLEGDQSLTIRLSLVENADEETDSVESSTSFNDYQTEVSNTASYSDHRDYLINTLGLTETEADHFISQAQNNVGDWATFQDFVVNDIGTFDELKEELADPEQVEEGDVTAGSALAGVEIHSSPGTTRGGEYISKDHWVEIWGEHIAHANTSEEDNDDGGYSSGSTGSFFVR